MFIDNLYIGAVVNSAYFISASEICDYYWGVYGVSYNNASVGLNINTSTISWNLNDDLLFGDIFLNVSAIQGS